MQPNELIRPSKFSSAQCGFGNVKIFQIHSVYSCLEKKECHQVQLLSLSCHVAKNLAQDTGHTKICIQCLKFNMIVRHMYTEFHAICISGCVRIELTFPVSPHHPTLLHYSNCCSQCNWPSKNHILLAKFILHMQESHHSAHVLNCSLGHFICRREMMQPEVQVSHLSICKGHNCSDLQSILI